MLGNFALFQGITKMSYFSDLAILKEEQAAIGRFNTMHELLKIPLLMAQKNAARMLQQVEQDYPGGQAFYALDDLQQLIGNCLEELEENVKL